MTIRTFAVVGIVCITALVMGAPAQESNEQAALDNRISLEPLHHIFVGASRNALTDSERAEITKLIAELRTAEPGFESTWGPVAQIFMSSVTEDTFGAPA
ncbi:MAG: hypothetical protein SGJ09_11740 [Phycisphaerae bacterium]|nr:hypothetical protein [Phycisphaerae bacterium]